MGTKNLNIATDLITFSRASKGTALRKVSYGSELVTNGTFDTDTSGWERRSSGILSVDNQRLKITNGGNNTGAAIQLVSVTPNKTYKVSFSVFAGSVSTTRIFLKDLNGSNLYTNYGFNATNQKFELFVSSSTGGISIAVAVASFTQGNYFFYDNFSVKEVLYDQPDGTLQLFNHSNNTPRIDHNADGTVKGLLIEEARTNLQPDNNSLETKSVTNLTTTANATTAPDGTNTAVKLTINAGETQKPRLLVGSGQDNPSNVSSIFAKAGEGSFNKIGLGAYNGSGYAAIAYFDLTTGTFDYIYKTSNRNISDYGIEPVGNGWYRIWIKPLNDSGSGFVFVASDDSTSASSATAGNGSDGLYIWGHQVEAGAFPTSYIPTTGSTATRAADVASIPTANFGYNDDAGTVVVNGVSSHKDGDSGVFYLYENNSNFMGAKFSNHNRPNSIQTRVVGSGGDNAQLYPTPALANTSVNYAVGFATNNVSAVIDGGTIESDTDVDLFAVSQMSIGYRGPYNDLRLNGHIKSIKYYPRRLTDTQLQELTT